jgi:hypothetical protein
MAQTTPAPFKQFRFRTASSRGGWVRKLFEYIDGGGDDAARSRGRGVPSTTRTIADSPKIFNEKWGPRISLQSKSNALKADASLWFLLAHTSLGEKAVQNSNANQRSV